MPTEEERKADEAKKKQQDIDLQKMDTAALAQKQKDIENAMEMLPENPSESQLEKLDKKIEEHQKVMEPIFDAVGKELEAAFGQGLSAAWMAMCKAMIAFERAGGKPLITLKILDLGLLASNPIKYMKEVLNPLKGFGLVDPIGWGGQTYDRVANSYRQAKRSGIESANAVKDLANTAGALVNLWDKQPKIDPRINKDAKKNLEAAKENSNKTEEVAKKTAADAFKPTGTPTPGPVSTPPSNGMGGGVT